MIAMFDGDTNNGNYYEQTVTDQLQRRLNNVSNWTKS